MALPFLFVPSFVPVGGYRDRSPFVVRKVRVPFDGREARRPSLDCLEVRGHGHAKFDYIPEGRVFRHEYIGLEAERGSENEGIVHQQAICIRGGDDEKLVLRFRPQAGTRDLGRDRPI